jgi:hypothetical protein
MLALLLIAAPAIAPCGYDRNGNQVCYPDDYYNDILTTTTSVGAPSSMQPPAPAAPQAQPGAAAPIAPINPEYIDFVAPAYDGAAVHDSKLTPGNAGDGPEPPFVVAPADTLDVPQGEGSGAGEVGLGDEPPEGGSHDRVKPPLPGQDTPTFRQMLLEINSHWTGATNGWVFLFKEVFNWDLGAFMRPLLGERVPKATELLCQRKWKEEAASQAAVLEAGMGRYPAVQLQALRTTPIIYPEIAGTAPSRASPGDIVHFYKLTFKIDSVRDASSISTEPWMLRLWGVVGDTILPIELQPGQVVLEVSGGSVTYGGESSIVEYWNQTIDRVCLEFQDPNRVLDRHFLSKLPEDKRFCTPVVEVEDEWMVYTLNSAMPRADSRAADQAYGHPEQPGFTLSGGS